MTRTIVGLSICLVFCLSSAASAQMGDYVFTISDATAGESLTYTQTVSLSVMNSADVSGWSMSICHDTSRSDVCGIETTSVVLGLNLIGPLFFQNQAIDDAATSVPGSTDGAVQGIVIDQGGFFFFPNGSTLDVLEISYLANAGTAGQTSTTSICNTVGTPNVEPVVVCCGGQSVGIGPNLQVVDGTVSYTTSDSQWSFGVAVGSVGYDPVTGLCTSNCTQTVHLTLANTVDNAQYTEGAGLSMGIVYDPTVVTVNSVTQGPGLSVLNGGAGPDLYLANNTGTGVSVLVQNTNLPAIPVLPYNPDLSVWGGETVVTLDCTFDTTALAGDMIGTNTAFAWGDAGDGIGNSVTVVCGERGLVGLSAVAVDLADAAVGLTPAIDLPFLRGDCNQDGIVNIADVVWTISGYITMPPIGDQGQCAEACDTNEDDSIDISDVIYTLSYRFTGGPEPVNQFPTCDVDPGADCANNPGCP
ncbi:MAG: hypothetical protein AAF581_17745 [Planctomycetota bacterium]